jgi:RNA polymerase sigma-70 factor (ECF subfamily)
MSVMPTGSASRQEELVSRASSDERAYARLVDPHRRELHAHCYRMLGSLHDAEDALQETLLRAWRALDTLKGPGALRTWLYRIATNVCLDQLAKRPKRVLPIDYGPSATGADEPAEPLADDIWIEPYPDERLEVEDGLASPDASYERRESIELAFIAALQHLPPRQRAVLILREVLGFSAKEVAASLDGTVPSVNSALQRARATLEQRLPDRTQQQTMRELGDGQVRQLVQRFMDAFEADDVGAIMAMLTEDATFSMPPYASWCRGRDAIAESWLMPGGPPPRLRYVPTRCNGQIALGTYSLDRERGAYLPIALDVLTLRWDRIADVTAFRQREVFETLGLPAEVPAR